MKTTASLYNSLTADAANITAVTFTASAPTGIMAILERHAAAKKASANARRAATRAVKANAANAAEKVAAAKAAANLVAELEAVIEADRAARYASFRAYR